MKNQCDVNRDCVQDLTIRFRYLNRKGVRATRWFRLPYCSFDEFCDWASEAYARPLSAKAFAHRSAYPDLLHGGLTNVVPNE